VAIARRVVLAHGGTISVRSNEDATIFSVRLDRGPAIDAAHEHLGV